MRIRRDRTLELAEGDMTPMIDMTFQLIAFFMVLLNFSEVEQDQTINLPSSELARPPEEPYEDPLTIHVNSAGDVLFSGERLGLDALQLALLREAQIIRAHEEKRLSDVTVIIRADREAKTGRVQEVIQTCQQAEFDTFALRGKHSDRSTLQPARIEGQ